MFEVNNHQFRQQRTANNSINAKHIYLSSALTRGRFKAIIHTQSTTLLFNEHITYQPNKSSHHKGCDFPTLKMMPLFKENIGF